VSVKDLTATVTLCVLLCIEQLQ